MRKGMPSCYQIFRHWEDKGILENGEVSDTGGRLVVENPYLPSCWACGRPVDQRNFLSWDKYDHEIKDIWEDKRVNRELNRCHILAKQFGGSNEPDNLFLLCEECHCESPDTKNREAFFRWVYRRKHEFSYGFPLKRMLGEAIEEIRSRGYDVVSFAKGLKGMKCAEVSALVEGSVKECGLHGTSIAISSVVVTIVDGLEQKVNSCRA